MPVCQHGTEWHGESNPRRLVERCLRCLKNATPQTQCESRETCERSLFDDGIYSESALKHGSTSEMERSASLDSQDSNMSLPTIPFSSDDRRSQQYNSNSKFLRSRNSCSDDVAYTQSRIYSLDRQHRRYSVAKDGARTTTPDLSIYQGLKTRFRALVTKIQKLRRRGSYNLE